MQYSEYITNYQAQKEREAQLVQKYSDKPKVAPTKALWSVTTVERHISSEKELWFSLTACIAIFGTIILLYCVFA